MVVLALSYVKGRWAGDESIVIGSAEAGAGKNHTIAAAKLHRFQSPPGYSHSVLVIVSMFERLGLRQGSVPAERPPSISFP